MIVRDTLLANLSVALTGSVTTSSELPFTAAGVPLFDKNMKKLYLDYDRVATSELIKTLNPAQEVFQRETVVIGYFTIDAKNLPDDIDTTMDKLRNARLSIANCYVRECSINNTYNEDRITYTVEYRFLTI
jgi:hypothetical protein